MVYCKYKNQAGKAQEILEKLNTEIKSNIYIYYFGVISLKQYIY